MATDKFDWLDNKYNALKHDWPKLTVNPDSTSDNSAVLSNVQSCRMCTMYELRRVRTTQSPETVISNDFQRLLFKTEFIDQRRSKFFSKFNASDNVLCCACQS